MKGITHYAGNIVNYQILNLNEMEDLKMTKKNKNKIIDKYLEAAKINQENLWKRRQIEWKTSFALWTAIATFSGYIYYSAHRPIPHPYNWIFLITILIVYIGILWIQHRHLKAIFISSERDLDFINYFLNKMAWEINNADFKEKPERPEWSNLDPKDWGSKKEENEYYQKRKKKMMLYWNSILITVLIEILSLFILASMCFEIK
ncbi:MAG: hypothetical protein NT175_04180 [Bacteroidetes bacterium]|nr:hypothetical protein [Bacteroidota bacterium]